jgi:hypothetical protein
MAPKEFRKDLGWNFEEEWNHAPSKNQGRAEEFYGYEKWKEVAKQFLYLKKKFPSKFYLLHYDRLLNSTYQRVRKLFHFLEINIEIQTRIFVSSSKTTNKEDTYSVYKMKKHDDVWREVLNDSIIETVISHLSSSEFEYDFEVKK